MNNPWLVGIFGVATVYFGVLALRVLPTLLRLIAALRSGAVKWPGPIVRDPDPEVSAGMVRLGTSPARLFPTFFQYALGLMAAFALSLMSLLNEFLIVVVVREGNALCALILTLTAFIGGIIASKRALHHMGQVNVLLSDLASEAEPRQVDGRSAEAEYAIEHPLIGHRPLRSDADRALNLYCEGLACLHAGDRTRANILYQEAMGIDPSLHKRAREILSSMAQACSLTDAGPIYYWLGIHAENLHDFQQAAIWYEKAAEVFGQLGYKKRQGRAYCNLGTVQLKMGNHIPAMTGFEKAIALNPRDGIAHFNIGMLYYTSHDPEDSEYERALDAFANAIVADPTTYGSIVASRMRSHAYTWQEDLREVMQRVSNKQH